MENRDMMETEEDAAYVIEREEGEDIMEFQEEGESMEIQEEEGDIMESKEEEDIIESESEGEEEKEEEAEQLDEMRPPVVYNSWIGPDGITVHEIMCIDDGVIRLKNRCQFDDCAICYKPSTTHGKHQICCLPCGHMYGFSCIKKWLLQSDFSGKCPQCKTLCTVQDATLLYPPPLCVTAHQKASLTAFFPLTKQGFSEFKEYQTSLAFDALRLQVHDMRHKHILASKHNDLVDRAHELTTQSDNLLTQAEELEERPESLELADALRRQASLLKPQIDALGRRTDALKRLVIALRRRIDALGRRTDAFESRLAFFAQMYKEHHKKKKNNNEPCTTCMKKKDKKKMQASGTVKVPKEEPVEDIAVEHEEEKVEEKAKPTTKTTERLRASSRSNKGKGPDSTSKVILKRK